MSVAAAAACAAWSGSAAASETDEALPFEQVDVAELVEQSNAPPVVTERARPRYRVMSPEGVEDPFPDRAPKVRLRTPAALMTLGLGLSASSMVVARLSLLPDCEDRSDLLTCEVPDGADIGVRGGRLFGAVAFGVAGAGFGGLGGALLGRYLQQGPASTLERRRRVAIGIGSTSVALGVVGLVVGSTLFGVGASRARALAEGFEDTGVTVDDLPRLEQTMDQLAVSRAGLMLLVASPTFVATGVALLIRRPRSRRVSVTPQIGRSQFSVSLSGKF